MKWLTQLLKPCLRGFALLALLAGCSGPQPHVALQQDMRMGPFTLQATSANAYSRSHQGVPWEVAVSFSLSGGNRFDRAAFADQVSRRGPILFQTSDGWRDRSWLLTRGEDCSTLVMHANPPLGSHGYTVEIGNPYGKPSKFVLDLGV
jgi:hypothetical protein